jgi:hypothetical protein
MEKASKIGAVDFTHFTGADGWVFSHPARFWRQAPTLEGLLAQAWAEYTGVQIKIGPYAGFSLSPPQTGRDTLSESGLLAKEGAMQLLLALLLSVLAWWLATDSDAPEEIDREAEIAESIPPTLELADKRGGAGL